MAGRLLSNMGAKLMVSSGEEAIQWLDKFKADVILMDLQMPDMDGFEALTDP